MPLAPFGGRRWTLDSRPRHSGAGPLWRIDRFRVRNRKSRGLPPFLVLFGSLQDGPRRPECSPSRSAGRSRTAQVPAWRSRPSQRSASAYAAASVSAASGVDGAGYAFPAHCIASPPLRRESSGAVAATRPAVLPVASLLGRPSQPLQPAAVAPASAQHGPDSAWARGSPLPRAAPGYQVGG